MKPASQTRITDITEADGFRNYLYKCIVGPPSKSYGKRIEYLHKAIPRGFHKKLLVWNEQVVGQIEYSPATVSYYPIMGKNIVVLNCIWVLRKAEGHHFGRQLLEDMIKSEKDASGFATLALENHWTPWFRKEQMEKLGFKPLNSITVTHKAKHKERVFRIHLMWMPINKKAKPPTWNPQKLLEGITSCIAHPLYHPRTYESKRIFERQQYE